jgi:hypothetical protein
VQDAYLRPAGMVARRPRHLARGSPWPPGGAPSMCTGATGPCGRGCPCWSNRIRPTRTSRNPMTRTTS